MRAWALCCALLCVVDGWGGRRRSNKNHAEDHLTEEFRPATRKTRCLAFDRGVDCLDLGTCANGTARRRAFVSVFDAYVKLPLENRKGPGLLEHEAKVARVARRNGADRIFVFPVPEKQKVPVAAATIAALEDLGVKIRYSDHVVPPKLSAGILVESGGCCGAREFLKLEPMGYGEYDAMVVADLDYDPEERADFGPLFDCVAEGRVLTTRGPEVPVNGALLAVPPSELLRSRLRAALETARVDYRAGWNGEGWGPNTNAHFHFQARMQGFFHWFFYRSRLSAAAKDAQARWRPAQVDPCVWNVQKGLADVCARERCAGRARAYGHLHHPPENCACVDDADWNEHRSTAHTCEHVAKAPDRRCGSVDAAGRNASLACPSACDARCAAARRGA